MKLKPVDEKKTNKFERLFCELLESRDAVYINKTPHEVHVYLETDSGFVLILTEDGKWRLE